MISVLQRNFSYLTLLRVLKYKNDESIPFQYFSKAKPISISFIQMTTLHSIKEINVPKSYNCFYEISLDSFTNQWEFLPLDSLQTILVQNFLYLLGKQLSTWLKQGNKVQNQLWNGGPTFSIPISQFQDQHLQFGL